MNNNIEDVQHSDDAGFEDPSILKTTSSVKVGPVHYAMHVLISTAKPQATMSTPTNPSGGIAKPFTLTGMTAYFITNNMQDSHNCHGDPSTNDKSVPSTAVTAHVRSMRIDCTRIRNASALVIMDSPSRVDVPFLPISPNLATDEEERMVRVTALGPVTVNKPVILNCPRRVRRHQ